MKVEWVPIGDVLEMRRMAVEIEPGESYRKVGLKSWGQGFIHYPAEPSDKFQTLRYFSMPSEALVVSNIKGWEGALDVSGADEDGFLASQRFLPWVPRDGRVDVRYVRHYLLSVRGMDLLGRVSPGSADRNRTLKVKAFENELIPLPSLADQRCIADHLDSVVATSNKIVGQGRVESVLESLRRLLPDAPERPFGEIFALSRERVDVDVTESYERIGLRSHGLGFIKRAAVPGDQLLTMKYYAFPNGALMISNIMACHGALGVVDDSAIGAVASHRFLPYVPTGEVDISPSFVRQYLLGPKGMELLGRLSPGTSPTNRTLNRRGLEAEGIPVPPRAVQDRWVDLLERVESVRTVEARVASAASNLVPSARNEVFSQLAR